MFKYKKLVVVPVLLVGLTGSLVGCRGNSELKEVVKLEEQKTVIDQAVLVKSLENLKDFQGDRWLEDGILLGVRDQPLKGMENSQAKISFYDTKDDEFRDIITGKEREWLLLGEDSEDGKKISYLSLIGGDFQRNLYDFNILDLESEKTETIIKGISSASELRDGYMYLGKGKKLYRYGFNKELEEVDIPKKLLDEFDDFNDFGFDQYLEMYYKNETVEGSRRDKIREHFEYSKKYNDIRLVTNLGDQVVFNSSNGKSFVFNTKDKTYILEEELEVESEEASKKRFKKPSIIEKEFKDDGTKVLWKLDASDNRDRIIDTFTQHFNVELSPDKTKVVYNSESDDGTKSSYIYDLQTDEKIKIYPDVTGRIYWNKDSNMFFIDGRTFGMGNGYRHLTSLIKLK